MWCARMCKSDFECITCLHMCSDIAMLQVSATVCSCNIVPEQIGKLAGVHFGCDAFLRHKITVDLKVTTLPHHLTLYISQNDQIIKQQLIQSSRKMSKQGTRYWIWGCFCFFGVVCKIWFVCVWIICFC